MTVSIFRPSLPTRLAKAVRALFSTGTNGYIYDPSDMASLYQDSVGTTPVTAVTNPVGMVLDKHVSDGRGVVNLLTYTEQFDNAVWAKGKVSVVANSVTAPDGTLTADKAVITTGNGVVQLNENITLVVGTTYTFSVYAKKGELTYVNLGAIYNVSNFAGTQFDLNTGTVLLTASAGAGYLASNATITAVSNGYYLCKVNITVGIANAFFNSGPSNTVWASGDLAQIMTGDGTSGIYLWGAQLEVGTTATAYQVNTNSIGGPGNHALQATAAARPTWTNRVNLSLYSEQFDNAAWIKENTTITANSVISPDGNLTADTLVESATTAYHDVYQTKADWTINTPYTISLYAKYAGRRYLRVNPYDGVTAFGAVFDIQNGVLGSYVLGGVSRSIESIGNGWYRLIVTVTTGITVGTGYIAVALQDADNASTYAGDGVSGAYLFGFQVELGSTATRYQRVTTATNFDTVGFPYYLSFLGTDDSLSSATGGGGSAGFFWCGAVSFSGINDWRCLWSDYIALTGYAVYRSTSPYKFQLRASNGSAQTILASNETINNDTKYLLTCWDDGVNLNVQVNGGAVNSVARPVVVAGTAGYTIAKDNGSATSFFIGNLYASVYAKNTGLTAAQRASVQAWVKQKAGIV